MEEEMCQNMLLRLVSLFDTEKQFRYKAMGSVRSTHFAHLLTSHAKLNSGEASVLLLEW